MHSWNPEFSNLAQAVYSPKLALHERQPSLYLDIFRDIEPPDFFEKGLDRHNSTWKNVSIQSVLGNACSRSRAVALMELLKPSEQTKQVLITRWDLGQSGSNQVNQLVFDSALPKEYIYFSYYSEVDEGYADMWIIAPWNIAKLFANFYHFTLDCLAGRNNYLDMFTSTGWPNSSKKSTRDLIFYNPVFKKIISGIDSFIKNTQEKINCNTLPGRAICKFFNIFESFSKSPTITAENSYIPNFADQFVVYPKYQALNIHALLKFFTLYKQLRDKTRFLASNDFELVSKSGQLISPQSFILFLWEDDDHSLECLINKSPLPIAAIYLVSEGKLLEVVSGIDGQTKKSTLAFSASLIDSLLTLAIERAVSQEWSKLPLLILPSVKSYLACSDWFYLNALLKYIIWSEVSYIGIGSKKNGRPSLEFPDIEFVRGEGAFSMRKVVGSVAGIRSLIGSRDNNIQELVSRINQMALELPSIKSSKKLF